jgi:hypothetical protein
MSSFLVNLARRGVARDYDPGAAAFAVWTGASQAGG